MQVTEVNGEDVVCLIKNSATLSGPLYTLHVSQIRIDLPTLTDKDKEVSLSVGMEYFFTVLDANIVICPSKMPKTKFSDCFLSTSNGVPTVFNCHPWIH